MQRGWRARLRPHEPGGGRDRPRLDQGKRLFASLGAVTSVVFLSVGERGGDDYAVTFEHGRLEWRIKLGEDGRIETMLIRPKS